MTPDKRKRALRPLDREGLRALALHYVGKYATSRGKLSDYLKRKLRERGWEDEGQPDVAAVVERMAELRYIDDALFAQTRASSLERRGYGMRRVKEALRAAGIDENDSADALDQSADAQWKAAETFARKKRLGPFSSAEASPELRRKHMAAFLRAGHSMDIARRFVEAAPGQPPSPDY